MKVASSAEKTRFLQCSIPSYPHEPPNKAFYCFRGLNGRGHFRLYLPPLYEELCIKIKETAQILKLNYSDLFFTK